MKNLVISSLEEAYRITLRGKEKSQIFDYSLFKKVFLDELSSRLNSVWGIYNEFAGKIFIKRTLCYLSWADYKTIPKLIGAKFVATKEIAENQCIRLNRVLSEIDYDWLYFSSLNIKRNSLLNWSVESPIENDTTATPKLSTQIQIDFSEIKNIKYE